MLFESFTNNFPTFVKKTVNMSVVVVKIKNKGKHFLAKKTCCCLE